MRTALLPLVSSPLELDALAARANAHLRAELPENEAEVRAVGYGFRELALTRRYDDRASGSALVAFLSENEVPFGYGKLEWAERGWETVWYPINYRAQFARKLDEFPGANVRWDRDSDEIRLVELPPVGFLREVEAQSSGYRARLVPRDRNLWALELDPAPETR